MSKQQPRQQPERIVINLDADPQNADWLRRGTPTSEQRGAAATMATFTDAAWDGSASRFTIEQWRRSCLIDTGQGDPSSKDRYKVPVREPDGTYNKNGIRNALSRIGSVDSPKGKAAALARLHTLAREAKIGDY